jgi:hypothetical protein
LQAKYLDLLDKENNDCQEWRMTAVSFQWINDNSQPCLEMLIRAKTKKKQTKCMKRPG